VWNNSQWGAVKKNQVIWYGDRYVGSNLANPNFSDVAKTMGAQGITVEKEGDLQPAVHEAIASGRPTVVNVVVDSVGCRRRPARLVATGDRRPWPARCPGRRRGCSRHRGGATPARRRAPRPVPRGTQPGHPTASPTPPG
jgi:hypothetical protein